MNIKKVQLNLPAQNNSHNFVEFETGVRNVVEIIKEGIEINVYFDNGNVMGFQNVESLIEYENLSKPKEKQDEKIHDLTVISNDNVN